MQGIKHNPISFTCTDGIRGCSKSEAGNADVGSVDKINLTYVKSPLNVPSIIQKHKELFEAEFGPEDIDINLFEITSGPEQTQALAAGELDFKCLGGHRLF